MTQKNRIAIAALVVSAAGFVGIAQYEGYTDKAIIPVKGDVPTKGFGTTRGVKLGDTTTPQRAMLDLLRDVNIHSEGLKKCIHVPLTQNEFDAYSSLAYNVGVSAVCNSTIPIKLNAGDYDAACKTILDFNGMCTKRNAVGKCIKFVVIKGLDNRRKKEYATCIS